MTGLTRKQREIAERHNHFLGIARDLLRDEGFHQLSMDRVAELAEYSKGTVYQHFNCKEEMVGQLCINAMQRLHALGQRATHYPGSHRERLLAFFIANDVFQQMEEDAVCNMQSYQHDQIITKISDSTRNRHDELLSNIFCLVKSIVEDAMRDGDLPNTVTSASAEDMVFGFWSLNHGAQAIRSNQYPLEEMGIGEPGAAIMSMLQSLLDGLGWKKDQHDHPTNLEHLTQIRDALFSQQALSNDMETMPQIISSNTGTSNTQKRLETTV